jgi:pyruvate formate lyase activating enzyme
VCETLFLRSNTRAVLYEIMRIGAALGFNLIDFPGRIAAVAFTPGCNYRCPHCHAKPLLGDGAPVSDKDFFAYLDTVKDWVNGVTICGGEPTLQPDLEEFIREVHCRGFAVKLDTNGSDPVTLAHLLEQKLVNYVAMDVKGPRTLWPELAGAPCKPEAMVESIRLVAKFPQFEFRTTVAPVVRGAAGIDFLTVPEMASTASLIAETTKDYTLKYYVQKFVPRKGGLIDARLEEFPETPLKLLQEIMPEVRKRLPNAQQRG